MAALEVAECDCVFARERNFFSVYIKFAGEVHAYMLKCRFFWKWRTFEEEVSVSPEKFSERILL